MPVFESAAVIGLGEVGSGWASLCIARGIDVFAYDIDKGARERVALQVEKKRRALDELGLGVSRPGTLHICRDMQEATETADFVLENATERLADKRVLYRELDAVVPANVVVSSSTSGIPMTLLQEGCEHPHRMVVGHPFAPVHLVPLVEVVGGRLTHAGTIVRAVEFFELLAKRPIHVRTEVPGFLANRFQTLVLQEALSLVKRGVATAAEIDAAFVFGPGLRWALYGPFALAALAAGTSGVGVALRRFEEHRNRVLGSIEPLQVDDSLIAEVERQVAEASAGLDPQTALDQRDRALVRLLLARASETRN